MNKLLFKRIDFWLQFLLNLTFFSSFLLYISISILSEIPFISFLLIVFWQISSAIIIFSIYRFNKLEFNLARRNYMFGLILLILILIWYYLSLNSKNFDFFLPSFLFSLLLLVSTIWYLIITWKELQALEKSEKTNLEK